MALVLTVRSEFDVAKIIDALVGDAERHRAAGDAVGERLALRLADQIEDSLTGAVGDGPCFAERVAMAREQQAAATVERRARARALEHSTSR